MVPSESLWHIGDENHWQIIKKNKNISWPSNSRPFCFCILKSRFLLNSSYISKCNPEQNTVGIQKLQFKGMGKARFPKLPLLSYHQRKIIVLFYEGGDNVSSRPPARFNTEEQVETFDCSPVLFREKALCQLLKNYLFLFFMGTTELTVHM